MADREFRGYLIGEEMGQGPLGKIYSATKKDTGQQVVFRGFARPKNVDVAHWKQAEERFRVELEHAKQLDHPHIAKVYDFGDGGGDDFYHVVTEHFVGKPLKVLLQERGPYSVDELRPILQQAAEAVDYAVKQGLAHGDATPAHGDLSLFNILLTVDGSVKIINFGLAHCRNKLGSPYLAPEQLTGFAGDGRSDVYALGAVAYEMLVGEPVFTGENANDVCRRIHAALPLWMTNQPDWVNNVVDRMLMKNPAERYASASEAIADLHARRPPAGHVHQTRREYAPPPPWEPEHFQPKPSLADFELHHGDVRHKMEHYKTQADAAAKRARVMTFLKSAAIAAALFICLRDLFGLPQRASQARVVANTGTPQVYDVTSRGWQDLTARGVVVGDETIATGSNASVTLQLHDGTRLKLQPNGMLAFEELGYVPRKGRSKRALRLWQGDLWVRASAFRSGGRFTIGSPSAETTLPGDKETVVRIQGSRAGSRIANLRGSVAVTTPSTKRTAMWPGRLLIASIGDSTTRLLAAAESKGSEPGGAGGTALPEGKLAEVIANLLKQLDLPAEVKAELEKHPDLTHVGSVTDTFRQLITGLEEGILPPISAMANLVGMLNPAKTFEDSTAMAKAMTACQAIVKSMQMDFMDSNRYPASVNLKTFEGTGLSQEAIERIKTCLEGGQLKSYVLHAPDDYEFHAIVKDSKKTELIVRKGLVKPVKDKDE